MLDNVADDCSKNLSKKLIKIRCETGRLIGTDNELNVFKKKFSISRKWLSVGNQELDEKEFLLAYQNITIIESEDFFIDIRRILRLYFLKLLKNRDDITHSIVSRIEIE